MEENFNGEFLSSRADFERNFHILGELLKEGKMHFTEGSKKSIDGIRKVRILPNFRIDFNTVDESARLTANMASNFEEMKRREKDEK